MSRLPVCGPEGPLRATPPVRDPVPVRAVLFDFGGTLLQMASYEDRIRAALGRPVDEAEMAGLLDGRGAATRGRRGVVTRGAGPLPVAVVRAVEGGREGRTNDPRTCE